MRAATLGWLIAALVQPVWAQDGAEGAAPSPESYQRFERELRSALGAADPVAMALLVQYPLRINTGGGGAIELINASALQARFAEAFPPALRAAVAKSDAQSAPERMGERYLLANGLIWLDWIDHGNGGRFRVAVVNALPGGADDSGYPRLAYACESIKHRIVVDETADGDYRYRSWNLPKFPPAAPSLELNGHAEREGRGDCGHNLYTFERGDTRVQVSEPGCGETEWPQGSIAVEVNGKAVGDWACE